MSDTPDCVPAPWEAHLDASPPETDTRRSAFSRDRKRAVLKALSRGETLKAAAAAAGVSPNTVYNRQRADPHFAAACRAAVEVSAPAIELAAFQRGVTGVEEDVIQYGRHVGTRVRRSDMLLQTLLRGSNPDKYGPNSAGAARELKKKWRTRQRAKLRKEVRNELLDEQERQAESDREMHLNSIKDKLARMRAHLIRVRGFVEHAAFDQLIPPGWTVLRSDDVCGSCAAHAERARSEAVPAPRLDLDAL